MIPGGFEVVELRKERNLGADLEGEALSGPARWPSVAWFLAAALAGVYLTCYLAQMDDWVSSNRNEVLSPAVRVDYNNRGATVSSGANFLFFSL